ncbi:MAG: CoA transferase [Chloroflexi bacterium]|nr:CoA transferase [Chloroflexota bacterium]
MLPLEGITVLDLTRVLAGPYCTMMLGDMGADIVKVEPAGTGDESRQFGPPFLNGESTYFMSLNRNKRSIAINLKTPEGAEVLRRLIVRADVLLENFRPGALARLGFSYEAVQTIRPDIVYCSVSGFGQTGPLAHLPAYDHILQGMGGVMSLTGPEEGPPSKVGVPVADLTAGMLAAYAVVTALFHRQRTGEGQQVDTSLLDGQIGLLTFQAASYFATGRNPRRMANRHPSIAPYETLPTADGFVNIAVGNDALWAKFCQALGLEAYQHDPRFRTNADRVQNRPALIPIVEARFRTFSTADLLRLLEEAGIPCGVIASLDEVFANPQVRHLGHLQKVPHPKAGTVTLTAPPYRLRRTPPSIRRAPPTLGQHTHEILAEVGYDEAAVAALRERGAVQ